jgi:hypothetical protein
MTKFWSGEEVVTYKNVNEVVDRPEHVSHSASAAPSLELSVLEFRYLPNQGALCFKGEQPALATDDKVRPSAAIPPADSLAGVSPGEAIEELQTSCDDGFLERYVCSHTDNLYDSGEGSNMKASDFDLIITILEDGGHFQLATKMRYLRTAIKNLLDKN